MIKNKILNIQIIFKSILIYEKYVKNILDFQTNLCFTKHYKNSFQKLFFIAIFKNSYQTWT